MHLVYPCMLFSRQHLLLFVMMRFRPFYFVCLFCNTPLNNVFRIISFYSSSWSHFNSGIWRLHRFFFLQKILTSTYFGQPVGSAAAARTHLTSYLMAPHRDQYVSAIVQGFILQAQLIGFLPQNCPGHGKPDQSTWFDVTVDRKRRRWGFFFQKNMLIIPVTNHIVYSLCVRTKKTVLFLKCSFQWNLKCPAAVTVRQQR